MHVVKHTRGTKVYVTYYLACYVRLQVQNIPHYIRLRVPNMPGCDLRKYGWENGQTGETNNSNTFVLTAFNSFGLLNIFPHINSTSDNSNKHMFPPFMNSDY
jgi:hypothetical protein